VRYRLREGTGLAIWHRTEELQLRAGEVIARDL
jgi:hypothetical protein